MDNARSLLGSLASGLRVAKLARDAVERARLFRHQQNTLRSWARRVTPGPDPARPPVARPSGADRRAALMAHDGQSVELLSAVQARHLAERQSERDCRHALQHTAAANWQRLADQATAAVATAAVIVKWSGYLSRAWLATHPGANDNAPPAPAPAPTPAPPGPGPRGPA